MDGFTYHCIPDGRQILLLWMRWGDDKREEENQGERKSHEIWSTHKFRLRSEGLAFPLAGSKDAHPLDNGNIIYLTCEHFILYMAETICHNIEINYESLQDY